MGKKIELNTGLDIRCGNPSWGAQTRKKYFVKSFKKQ